MPGWSANTGSRQLARLPVEVDVASEFRYREPRDAQGRRGAVHLAIGRNRRHAGGAAPCQAQGQTMLAIVNVPESSIAREADTVLPTFAGPEIGVASTKAFTTQLTRAGLPRHRGGAGARRDRRARRAQAVSARCWKRRRTSPKSWRRTSDPGAGAEIAEAHDVLYLGRGTELSDRAGRRAQAQGNHLHPRRGLCRRRNEAWADRADRRERAGDRDRAAAMRCSTKPPPTCRRCWRAAAR